MHSGTASRAQHYLPPTASGFLLTRPPTSQFAVAFVVCHLMVEVHRSWAGVPSPGDGTGRRLEGARSLVLLAHPALPRRTAGGGKRPSAAALAAQSIAEAEGMYYVEDGEDPTLMAGTSSIAWEILEQLPSTDRIVVPVGGGNLIAGIALAAKRLNPSVRVTGVQSDAAPSVVRSFELGRLVEMPCATRAGGLATRFPGALSFGVIIQLVDEMVLVPEDDLAEQIRESLHTRTVLIEAAAAAPFRRVAALRGRLGGREGSACPERSEHLVRRAADDNRRASCRR